jgi:hypothetical protein
MKLMKKWHIVAGLILLILVSWLLLTAECVVNRANSGTSIDWANIKDCSY